VKKPTNDDLFETVSNSEYSTRLALLVLVKTLYQKGVLENKSYEKNLIWFSEILNDRGNPKAARLLQELAIFIEREA
jgi:hypothetical protein